MFFAKTPEKKKELGDDFFGKLLPNFLETSENLLKKAGGQYFVGGHLTWADIALMMLFGTVFDEENGLKDIPGQETRKELKTKYPLLFGLNQRVADQPGIKKWLETRPKNSF